MMVPRAGIWAIVGTSYRDPTGIPGDYADQFDRNLNASIGVSASLSIFDRFQTRSSVSQAKINLRRSQIGLEALERQLARDAATGRFCHGDAPTLADVCLVPQLANARRVAMDLAPYPTLTRIEAACLALPAFAAAAPARQPDAETP